MLLQQFGGAFNRGQRAFELMREAVYIVFHIGFAFQLLAHLLDRGGQLIQLGAAKTRHSDVVPLSDLLGVVLQTLDRTVHPPRHQCADEQRDTEQ